MEEQQARGDGCCQPAHQSCRESDHSGCLLPASCPQITRGDVHVSTWATCARNSVWQFSLGYCSGGQVKNSACDPCFLFCTFCCRPSPYQDRKSVPTILNSFLHPHPLPFAGVQIATCLVVFGELGCPQLTRQIHILSFSLKEL